eukprot:6379572-Prymnesium_polylepis.1
MWYALWKLKIKSSSQTLPKYRSSTCGGVGRTPFVAKLTCKRPAPGALTTQTPDTPHHTPSPHENTKRRTRLHLDKMVDGLQHDELVVIIVDARQEVQGRVPGTAAGR